MPAPEPVATNLNLSHSASSMVERIETVFNCCFASSEGLNTRLRGGFDEPYYRPEGEGLDWHQVEYTRDYPASALHEASHWCVAGVQRRQLPDYGYWYSPDGRCEEQQVEFERVEVKPQALEWIFARACGLRFRISADNLAGGLGPSEGFKNAIWRQVQDYCGEGINARAQAFACALAREFGRPEPLNGALYQLADLS